MEDNLMFLINQLSYQIVTQELEKEKNLHPKKKGERYLKKCMRKVSQKGCDVLLNKSCEPSVDDPCITDYGGNWSPLTLITDYGLELKAQGAGKCNEIILSSIKTLEEKQYDCVNELFKLLILLKKPFVDSSFQLQHDISFSGSDFLQNSIDSFSLLSDGYINDSLSRKSSYKRALQYEESWTKQFDSKFQVLGEFSKKNLLTPDKVSLDSLITTRSSLNRSQNQSNCFVFTDFFKKKNYSSEKSLFDFNSNTFSNDSLFLDSFVDNPITHKLPNLSFSQKHFSKSANFAESSEQMKRKLNLLHEEDNKESNKTKSCDDALQNRKKTTPKASAIELKRNLNCSHSFSILYEKSLNSKSQESSVSSNDSLSIFKGKRDKSGDSCLSSPFTNSKNIVLGLWEQDRTLIREFRPELAVNFPALRIIALAEYVEDVKYLLTGINSGTFQFDSNKNYFSMEYGTCLDDVTPESLFNFSKEFLDIGNCYMKLSSYASTIGKNNFDTCTTISQAFWKSIFDFLELHYSTVLEIPPSTNLMALKSSTRDLHEMITTVSEICKVSKPNETLPQGGELLTYLLHIAEKLSKQCVTNIVFGILQNCCSVYFMRILQTWMFKGQLEKQNNEFFADHQRQKIKIRSRAYYNSFYIADDKIPSFLRGYEENIFNCGKSIHFLKLFNAEDKFCQLLDKTEYPNMYLCLSDNQLEKLEKEFEGYSQKVIESCGGRVSIKDILNEEKEQEKYFLEYVKECKKIQERQRELIKLRELEDLKAKKELKNKLLNEQRNFIEAEKERKKMEEQAEKKKLEMEIKQADEKRSKMLNQEKSFIKHYYDRMLRTLEMKLNIAELRKENLMKILDNEESDYSETSDRIMDVINDNEINTEFKQLDNEGNITKEVDINSNSSPLPSENLVKVIDGVSPPESVVTVDKEYLKNSEGSVIYDENSNPSSRFSESEVSTKTIEDEKFGLNSETEPKEKIRKSASHRTIAAEEAIKNKYRVLKSEFDLAVVKEEIETKPQTRQSSMTDLERNRRKVLESEYDILRNASDCISIKSAHSKVQIAKENETNTTLPKPDVQSSSCSSPDFSKVDLERKPKCMDLENPPKKLNLDAEVVISDSSSSFVTPLNENMSEENISNSAVLEIEEEVVSTPLDNCESGSALVNTNYQNALARDVEIFHHKLPYGDIFCSLKETKIENLQCTDYMKFQRYLKRSVLIPLKIQEKLANDALLKHLLKGENLLSHLKSLRGYFFLHDGEFGRSFTYNTFRSLAKCTEPHQFFERSNLSNIVNEALNYTIHNCEPNTQNLSFQIVKMPPFLNHLSHDVLSPFELSYRVEWPLNIILTEKALSRYKTIFRFLLKLKRVNWTLNENFLFLNSHCKSKGLNAKLLISSSHYHKIQIYRHAMTHIMITLDDYIFSNGIQFPWIFFLKDLESTENIDHLYQKHVRYIKDVLERCFLTKNSEDLLDCIYNLIELALKFHYTSKSSVFEVVDGKYEHPKFQVLKTTFNEFCSIVKTFLKTLREKISTNQILKSHYVLIEKFDLKLT